MDPLTDWLITGALGPALVGLPVNWSAGRLGGLARRWLDRIRHEDGLSRLILATDPSIRFSRNELVAVRRLLEDPQTWQLIGSGTVEDLAVAIGACLPGGKDAVGDRVVAGRSIARGLLEFVVFDLEPEVFQRVLMARIARMDARQADRLDQAMLQLHASLAAWFAYQDRAGELRTRRVLTRLGRALDRLPPGPAGREEVSMYLATLIAWLNADPWPRDPRLGGSALTPASMERKLTISDTGRAGEGALDADDLAGRCTRLVVLGGPGYGKTWLAKRTARRCAEAALEALADGAGPDDVELPMITTCSLLAAATGGIRDAAVSTALDQLGDLGGSRITEALRALFTERNAPTLLVIDSLDEARHPDDRLRQADTLPWRIVLTSRPSSWNGQLAIAAADPLQLAGSLQALRYPQDVEPFIARWFAADPAAGRALTAQIRSRKDLQQAVTVPLILAFYCILRAEASLPEFRHEVYKLVLSRLLSGLWRGDGEDGNPDARAACLQGWAWAGATKDETTGIGTWADEVLTPYVPMSEPDRAAVDHVATPVQLPDLTTGATLRRFIHRSVREHLTAEHIATQMGAREAATELLNHLWYDPDWEYAAPAALAIHPKRDQVLKELICQAVRSSEIPDDLAGIDGCWELRLFLARVARESREASWTAESAALIGRARLDLAANYPRRLPPAPSWPTTNSQIRRDILAQLEAVEPGAARWLVEALVALDPAPGELAQARRHVLHLLDAAGPGQTLTRAELLTGLSPEPGELARVRRRIVHLLNTAKPRDATQLISALAGLSPEPGELASARRRVLDLLDTGPRETRKLAEELVMLSPDPAELARARRQVLELLDDGVWSAGKLANALVVLSPDPAELARARRQVLDLLDTADSLEAEHLAPVLLMLSPEPGELARARSQVLHLLDTAWRMVGRLAEVLMRLEPRPDDLARARVRVLHRLELQDAVHPYDALWLVSLLVRLSPEPTDLATGRRRVLDLLDTADRGETRSLVKGLGELGPGPVDLARARHQVMDLLDQASPMWASSLAETLATLAPEPGELAWARSRVLDLLDTAVPRWAESLAKAVCWLSPDPSELARARRRVLDLLEITADPQDGWGLAEAVCRLSPDSDDLAKARRRVLDLLAGPGIQRSAKDPERPEDLARDRRWVPRGDVIWEDGIELSRVLIELKPIADDLAGWASLACAPRHDLLAAARRNSPLRSWLAALPALAGLPI